MIIYIILLILYKIDICSHIHYYSHKQKVSVMNRYDLESFVRED
jgi:hypothetical protein